MLRSRRGAATLWTLLALPVMLVLICWVVEAGRLYLARQQLITSLESAALAGAKTWCMDDGTGDTFDGRQAAIDFAAANLVAEMPLVLDDNYSAGDPVNNNDSLGGDLVFGTIVEAADGSQTFDSTLRAGCGQPDGPNAFATEKVSSGNWQTVTMCKRDYNCMVVVATLVNELANDPMVVRIQNANAGNTFEYFVQDVNTGAPVAGVPVYFFVAEAGVYTAAADGATMEVVKYNSTVTDSQSSWVAEPRAYANAYAQPVVVGQVMTFNDPDWSVFWSHGGTRQTPPGANLFTGKHVGQDPDRPRVDETIGYVVIEQGTGSMNGLPYYARMGEDTVVGLRNGAPITYGLPGDIGHYVVASQSGEDGGNGGWAVAHAPTPLDPTSLDLGIDEYRLTDRNHTTEQVSHIVFGGPCAVQARAEKEVPWLCNLFGCVLTPPTMQGEVLAMVDCEEMCPKLICLGEDDPECISARFEAESDDVQKTTGGADPNGWNVWSDGEAFVDLDIPCEGTYRFCSRAWGQQGGPDLPRAELRVDGTTLSSFDVTPQSFADAQVYCVDVYLTAGNHRFAIAYVNDFYMPPIDRNLLVDWLQVQGPL